MYHISTRDTGKNKITASEAIVQGLAPDGGLYVPCHLHKLQNFIGKPYAEIAHMVLKPYLDFSDKELEQYIHLAYHNQLPVKLNGCYLELFHGRTLSFKDVGLQLYPHLLTAALRKNNITKTAVVITATSGDTGSAALAGIANVPNTKAIVLYPHNGVSSMQKLQMTTQEGDNVHVFGINGNFDDAQKAVKSVFTWEHIKQSDKYVFTPANSMNLGRLLPQIVYYFHGYSEWVQRGKVREGELINFVVPTGNFGNILAGYYASKMGLPINKLVCATNSNNVLCDFIKTGTYNKNRKFHATISPSMDILVSSNLERYLYDVGGCDAVNNAYNSLEKNGEFTINTALPLLESDFATDAETLQTIQDVYDASQYILDPHTAVGQAVYNKYKRRTSDETPTLILSTASPYKFPETIETQLGDVLNSPPESIKALLSKPVLHNQVISDVKTAIGDVLR